MKKIILTLDGKNLGKTRFNEIIKEHGYWVWNINYKNVLSSLSYKMYWDGVRNKKF